MTIPSGYQYDPDKWQRSDLDEDDYPQFTMALADMDSGVTISGEDVPFVKWGKQWAVPGCEGDECKTLAEIVEYHANVRVLRPQDYRWDRLS